MRKLVLFAFALTAMFTVNAQLETPQPSPMSKLEQKVGMTDVTIAYSRPGVKGRKIFGDLEPFGKIWRTGANANTTATFSTDFTFGGTEVKAGTYAIFVIPNPESWEVILYSETNNWGAPRNWDESKVVAKTTADVKALPWSVETFSIDINNINNDGATLDFVWDTTYVAVPFSVPTNKIVSASIDKLMAGPGAADYYSAAVYYLNANTNLPLAMTWIDKAIEFTSAEPKFWYLRQQALIHAANGHKSSAISAAKASLELAQKAGNDGYVKMNTDSLKEWGAM